MNELPRNTRLFALFRVFFNCRFYYPVYLVMFLDFGLTISQFATLNLIWAVAIILLEVPSGALADHLGRKRLVVVSAILMVAEIGVLLLTPVGSPIVFWMFVINRILSGAAEAAASGADEAMAYDSIPSANREALWRKTMKKMMIMMSIGFVISSIIGALVYSDDLVNSALGLLHIETEFTKDQTVKFPLYLNLGSALVALLIACRFKEEHQPAQDGGIAAIRESFAGTLRAGSWILRSPAATSLILIGLFYDSIIRVFYTVLSNVYRLFKLPEWCWGIVGAIASIVGIGVALLCERMAAKWSPSVNFGVVTVLTFSGCVALSFSLSGWGIVLLLPMFTAMRFLQYFLSHYLNQVTPSEQRATVLSFKGVTMNLAFGILTQVFGILTAQLYMSGRFDKEFDPELAAFGSALKWWPYYFAIGCILVSCLIRLLYRKGLTRLISESCKTEHNPND